MSYVGVIVVLGVLILVHELGHFVAARLGGLPVERFSVGFGPALWRRQHKGVEYRLSALPLGGYVLVRLESHDDYLRLPLARRLGFSLGGPAANLILAALLMAIGNAVAGQTALADLAVRPISQTAQSFATVVAALGHLLTHPGQVSSIVGIVAAGEQYVGQGVQTTLQFAAVLSVNLAVFNLLPLPPLDGGKMVLDVLHRLRPRLARLYVPACAAGWILLLGLMAWATVADVTRLADVACVA